MQSPFLEYFSATGGLTRYGYPITEAYVDPETKLVVQYFQRARLEWHPTNPVPYTIQLGLLGDELGKRMPPLPVKNIPSSADPSCYYFPETGHSVCYQFLDYWRLAGGLDLFGYPITEFTIEDGVIVQYFQRAKMEWQPSKPAGQRVQLAPLGEIYYKYAKLDPARLAPVSPDVIGPGSKPVYTRLQARAAVLNGSAPRGGMQSAYVLAVDQFNRPLKNAAVSMVIHYPSGDKSYQLTPTDDLGMSFMAFEAGTAVAGTIIPVEFTVSYPNLPVAQTTTSYMLWYYY